MVGCSKSESEDALGSSDQVGRLGVCIVAIVVPESWRSCVRIVAVLFWDWTLDLRELELGKGFRWMRYSEDEGSEEREFVRESLTRTNACAGFSNSTMSVPQVSSSSKSGSGDKRPHPFGRYMESSSRRRLRLRRTGTAAPSTIDWIPSSPTPFSKCWKFVGRDIVGRCL
jgi:hypothetical protein